MTNAVATSTSPKQTVPQSVPVVILGTDAILAALPATAVQLAHACIEAGFVNVIPASWGDELIATATLRRLPEFGDGPVIHCSCPIVAHRLLSVSGDLRPVLLPLVPPPVALARYVRALSHPNRARVTYVGGCPGAIDESIDIRMMPDALFAMLAERGIDIEKQPRVFESFIPADRRRFRSQPGGLPTSDALLSDHGSRSLAVVTSEDLAAEIAQHVLGGRNVLIDAAVKLGCVCSGATTHARTKDAREFLASLEPPRATAPVVNENTRIELDLHVPAAARAPMDIMAVPSTPVPNHSARVSPPRGVAAVPDGRQSPRSSSPGTRAIVGSSPVARPADGREGKTLPRAYVARRRLSPKSSPVVPAEPLSEEDFQATQELEQEESIERMYTVELIEFEVPPSRSDAEEPPASEVKQSPAPDAKQLATVPAIERPPQQAAESFEPVAFASDAMPAVEAPTTDRPLRGDPRVGRVDSSDTDDQLDVAIPLSHWTEPVASQLKNAEASDIRWSFGNGDGSALAAPTRTASLRFESPARADEPAKAVYTLPAPLNARYVVLVLLAVVAVMVAVSASVAILVERHFTPHAAAPTSNEASR